MEGQEARKHHFVPEFLLRPWASDGTLRGYWWDSRKGALSCKRKGPGAFCFQVDLLTLSANKMGRDALERLHFGQIDAAGAKARDRLLAHGPESLNGDERCDFARLLLSLDGRRPAAVAKLRAAGRGIAAMLDSDAEILAAMGEQGPAEAPSKYYERTTGVLLDDRALLRIQRLVDNRKVGGRLINAYWHIVRLGPFDGSFVLSDRPLIRLKAYDHPGAVWALPLTPQVAFVALNHAENLGRIKRVSPRRFAKKTNVSSAAQAERFVFASDAGHERWIGKHLVSAAGGRTHDA